ncbi:hypothetical protein ABFS82_14G262800 [Erythranthe guttata]
MIQTINPYATARTAEIMSRYRPIAPKPESPATGSAAENDSSAVPSGIRKSPYLRNVWAHLQARPTRTRKRGRAAAFSPPSVKRARTCLQGLASPYQGVITGSPAKNLAMHGFSHAAAAAANGQMGQFSLVPLNCGLDTAVTTLAESVAMPLVCPARRPGTVTNKGKEKEIDLNQGPEELDLLSEPVKPNVIISPRPVRPVGSSIIVKSISGGIESQTTVKGAEEVEELAEAEATPAIVSDSKNKVRLANSAYREMVGQPECGWLDCAAGNSVPGGAWRRIGGEVSLQFVDTDLQLSARGFTCRVKIVWESEGKNKCVEASCVGVRLACEAKDYQFLWRFHIVDDESISESANSDN